jgi:hypothetical protein
MSGQTGIAVSGRFSPMAFFLYLTHLTVEVDGQAEAGGWKNRFVPVPPGPHDVNVYFWYLGKARCCEASTTVHVADGQTVSLQYRAPRLMTSRGHLDDLTV